MMADVAKIKRNIGRMIDQGAPESDINSYIASEGATLDDLHGGTRGVADRLFGLTGERYQTWPERLVRGVGQSLVSGFTLPHDVMTGEASPNDIGRVMDMAGLAMPINPAIRAGDAAIPGVAKTLVPGKVPVPTTEQLASAGSADINAARQSGLQIAAPAVSDFSQSMQQQLFDKGIHPVDAPNTYTKLRELENAPPGSYATAANLQSLRESLGHTAQNFNPAAAKDQLAASRAISGLDSFLPQVDPQSVLAGSPSATSDLLQRGRGNYAAAMRSNDLTGALDRANTGILERAESRAQAANSGRNLDNTIRQKVASLLEKPKEVSGFSDPEIAALNDVIQGSGTRNFARYLGNFMGGGGGMGQAVSGSIGAGVGAVVGGPTGAVVGAATPLAVGSAAKSVANALAKRSLSKTDELVRMRSPLYQEAVNSTPMVADGLSQKEAIARLLMLQAAAQRQ